MSDVFFATVIGSMVGIFGTGLGGLIALSIVKPNTRLIGMILGVTSGLMLAVVAFDLLPEAYEISGLWVEILGIILGILMIFLIEDFIPSPKNARYAKNINNGFFKTGALLGIGIAMHNLPEGLAIGSGFMLTPEMGITMTLVIALHNLPEGVAMATPLRISGSPKLKVVMLTLLAGLPTGLGALIGSLLGSVSNFFIGLCLAFAGGTMLYITCGELIPNAKALHKGRASTIGLVIGFIIGIIVSAKL
ncbi:ZIP family metal transporter [Brassicibacter mesophilus]|uniref:ZIP family metal transporter n=1 Tax=Brassicibacter mesophilus TaxID=745119 RepID=UPI003D246214